MTATSGTRRKAALAPAMLERFSDPLVRRFIRMGNQYNCRRLQQYYKSVQNECFSGCYGLVGIDSTFTCSVKSSMDQVTSVHQHKDGVFEAKRTTRKAEQTEGAEDQKSISTQTWHINQQQATSASSSRRKRCCAGRQVNDTFTCRYATFRLYTG